MAWLCSLFTSKLAKNSTFYGTSNWRKWKRENKRGENWIFYLGYVESGGKKKGRKESSSYFLLHTSPTFKFQQILGIGRNLSYFLPYFFSFVSLIMSQTVQKRRNLKFLVIHNKVLVQRLFLLCKIAG